jgi:hypothetical protein
MVDMKCGYSHKARGRVIWEERKKRQAIIEEFFRAYDAARRANRVFMDTYVYGTTKADVSGLVPACIAHLGLPWPCTVQDVRQAFRAKVKTVHPDTGGSNEAFQALHSAYKEALALVG